MAHQDSYLHLRGESKYIGDNPPPQNTLFMSVLGSPIGHGKIRKIETQKAESLEGVVKILTHKDIPGENQIGPLIPDEELLASTMVEYMGQPIALVLAEDKITARKAVKEINLEIEPLPVIMDPVEAYKKGEIIGSPRTFVLGDLEKGFKESQVIIEGECETGGQEHLYLETQRALAVPKEDGGILLYSSTQSPSAVQRTVSKVLGLPQRMIEVDVKRLGGGFGGKEDQATPWACMASLGAWITKRPVLLVLHRLEDMLMTGKRHPYKAKFRMGLTKEGKILAYEVTHFQNAGASADLSPAILERTLFHSTNAYFIPNVRIHAISCKTNQPPHTAFRGFGGPQGMFAIEAAIAKAAETLGMHREEIQKRNLLKEGDMLPYGQRTEKCHAQKTWEALCNKYNIQDFIEEVHQFNQRHLLQKKGYAFMPICFGISFTATFLNQGRALVHVYTDGSVSISTGGIEMGQGLTSNLIRLASSALGIGEDKIQIETTNTTRIANISPSAASATTDLNGHATLLAIQEILQNIKEVVCHKLTLPDPQKITIEKERVYYNGADTGICWQEAVMMTYFERKSLSAHGHYATPHIYFDKNREKGRPFAYHVYGTAFIQVTVDILRGTYDIDRIRIVHDLGRSINPVIDLGQIEGGLAQGLGWMTLEELAYNSNGKLLSHALATYKAPDIHFMPDDMKVLLLETENPVGPRGSKAVGEPPLMYGIGVFFAIRHALLAWQKEDYPLVAPLTPEKVFMNLYGSKSQKKELVL